jgi:hypothetical protein
MSDNSQKLNQGAAAAALSSGRAFSQISGIGQSLPVALSKVVGGIVTGNFQMVSGTGQGSQQTGGFTLPPVEMPALMSQYLRLPLQPGEKGVTMGADTSIDNVSGLGRNTPQSYTRPANMGPSVFVPVANKDWETTKPNYITMYGVKPADDNAEDKTHGTAIYDQVPSKAKASVVVETDADSKSTATLKVEGCKIVVTKDGVEITIPDGKELKVLGNNVKVTLPATGDVMVGTISLKSHVHTGTTPGSGITGAPQG